MEIKEISSQRYKMASDSQKAKAKEDMDKLRKEGAKMRKGIFEFVDAQGGWLDFSYRFYPGEPIRTVRSNHGEIVDLPLDVIKHLNNVYKKIRMPNREMTEDGRFKGQPSVQKISRCRFTPTDVI